MKKNKILLVSLIIALASVSVITVNAKKATGPILLDTPFLGIVVRDRVLPNGNIQVDRSFTFGWESSEFNGVAEQHVKGIMRFEKGKTLVTLSGYGIFHCAEGDIYYRIRNNYYPNPNSPPEELWYLRFFADRFTIQKGTGIYENIHGYGILLPDTMQTELYIHYEPA